MHLPTPDWLDGSMAGYVEAAEAYFRSPVQRQSLSELADRYRELGLMAVLLAWDAETATGRPRVPNETVAAACRDYPDVFTGLGSVDPHKGDAAVAEVANIAALGLRGVKFHPSLQAFAPDDPQFWPVFAACQQHGLLALFHTGTSGIGARQPGGQGIRIDYAHPLKLDPVAAAHPGLTVVAAHFGWPWQMDLIAVALHKTNVFIDISGWSPRRIPPEVIAELRGRLSDQFVWGSDYPFIAPERCLSELDDLGLTRAVRDAVLRGNAARILGLPAKSPARPSRCGRVPRLVNAKILAVGQPDRRDQPPPLVGDSRAIGTPLRRSSASVAWMSSHISQLVAALPVVHASSVAGEDSQPCPASTDASPSARPRPTSPRGRLCHDSSTD